MIIKKLFRWMILLLICAALGYFAYSLTQREVPNDEHVGIEFYGKTKPIFYNGEIFADSAIGEKDGLKLPYEFVRTYIDSTINYDKSSKSVIVTTEDKVVRLRTNGQKSTINQQPINLQFPIESQDDVVYIPIDPLLDLYDLEIRENEQTGIVTLVKAGDPIQHGLVTKQKKDKPVPMRTGASIREPILSDLAADTSLMIWSETDEWYHVQLENGMVGYVQKQQIRLDRIETVPHRKEPVKPYIPWKPTGGKINLTWEHVTGKSPNIDEIGPMPGLNVISPTWFHLADAEGNLKNNADAAYVRWAHGRDLQVWGLVDNSFDPKLTSQALSTYDRRMTTIKQLLSFAKLYKLQGINLDYENVSTKDKQNFIQFVREFTPLAHELDLVVSIDVTPKSESEGWSLFLDRRVLAETVDYMILMGYDEHWGSSPKAGSVASLPWVENALTRILEEDDVPPSKFILAVPTFTREWTEEQVDGKTKVSSKAIFMSRQERTIREKKLTPTFLEAVGQNYVEYKEGTAVKKIWMEDAVSMKARVELVKKYNLAGIASWRRGFEEPEIWDVIQETLTKRP